MDELLEQFAIEGRELVEQACDDLAILARQPGDRARLDSIFRAVHTLKGSAALFDCAPMTETLHASEDMLGIIRDGRVAVSQVAVDTLLRVMDLMEGWIGILARQGRLEPSDARGSADLRRALDALAAPAPEGRARRPSDDQDWAAMLLGTHAETVASAQAAGQPVTALRYRPASDCFFLGDDPLRLLRDLPNLLALEVTPREPWDLQAFQPFTCNLVIDALVAAPAADIAAAFRFVADQVTVSPVDPDRAAAEASTQAVGARSLRIDVGRIDAMGDLVGELVVMKNRLADLAGRAAAIDAGLGRTLGAHQADLDRLAGAMHHTLAGMRMVPLARTFRRLPRLVRDTAAQLGKDIRFEIVGEEIEADKAVVDALFEPLLHVLRNAVDHGIEVPAVRAAAGKAAAGRIELRACREGDRIAIAVSDDGAGLDVAKIRDAARTRGLLDGEAGPVDDAGIVQLVFAPGFSTSATVSSLSGRGVGMDAVRRAIEALGGRVALAAGVGGGSVFTLTVPGAIILRTLVVVRVGTERFGIPLESVAETLRLSPESILAYGDGEAFVSHGRTLPLLHCAALLALPAKPRADAGAKIVVVRHGDQSAGIEVDGFAERIDVVLRPATGILAGVPGLLGTALMGDGTLLVVLDTAELIA